MKYKQNHAIYVVIGPTASGKSEYAVKLAKKYNGEIISADSRQVYHGLDIGSGKVEGKWKTLSILSLRGGPATKQSQTIIGTSRLPRPDQSVGARNDQRNIFVYKNIPHHCIDYIDPKKQYSVAQFKHNAEAAIADILARGKTPIICGGTGQFVDAVLFNQVIPEIPPNPKLRKKLESKTPAQLFALLKKKDLARAATIDPHNPRRLIRALEIIHATGRPVPILNPRPTVSYGQASSLILKQTNSPVVIPAKAGIQHLEIKNFKLKIHYLNPPREELYKKIEKRLNERLQDGILSEVFNLHKNGLTWKRMEDFGLEYRYVSRFLKSARLHSGIRNWKLEIGNFITSPFYTQLLTEIKHYAKRQQTWFKKYNI